MYLYFAAKIRKSIHIIAYQCIKKTKSGGEGVYYILKKEFNIYEKRGRFTSTSFLQSN